MQGALQGATIANRQLTDEQKATLERLRNILVTKVEKKDIITGQTKIISQPSEASTLYDTYAALYQGALIKYNNCVIAAKSPTAKPQEIQDFQMNGPIYYQQCLQAYQKWEAEGYRGDIEEARAYIAQYSTDGVYEYFEEMRAAMENSKRANTLGPPFLPAYFFPRDFFSPEMEEINNFTKFSFDDKKVDEFKSDDKTSFGGGADRDYFFSTIQVEVDGKSETKQLKIDTSNMSLSVEIAQLPIQRPWFDATVLKSRAWKWNDDGCISNGEEPRNGLMGVFPTSMLVSRNLKLQLDMSSQVNKSAMEEINTATSVNFLFFTAKGNFNKKDTSEENHLRMTSDGIECDDLQIIGFICEKVDRCPNPDPNLDWGSSMKLKDKVPKEVGNSNRVPITQPAN